MPFADKFRAMLDMPFPGDALGAPPEEGPSGGAFTVESINVAHEGRAPGHYAYPFRLELRGAGRLAALKRAIKPLFARRSTTFSGFGTPYQLWFGPVAIERLDGERYAVTGEGAGVRVHLQQDLLRFCEDLSAQGRLSATPEEREALVADYIARYQAEVARVVGRYRTRIKRADGPNV
jgi:hypothetical protein